MVNGNNSPPHLTDNTKKKLLEERNVAQCIVACQAERFSKAHEPICICPKAGLQGISERDNRLGQHGISHEGRAQGWQAHSMGKLSAWPWRAIPKVKKSLQADTPAIAKSSHCQIDNIINCINFFLGAILSK